ncbi:MAG: beta-phosphoglucomutase [Planctomycetes bacterium]|nr:beta-phosphoglucomutase [Planctomycetota bacterium]
MADARSTKAVVIFDLDGVLTDTVELHFRSWKLLTDELGIPFDRRINESLRGLSRSKSLEIVLGEHAERFNAEQQRDLADRKSATYLEFVGRMSPDDVLPGAVELLADLRARGVPVAVASSSRNARKVIDGLALRSWLDVIVDGNDVALSKPAPDLFLEAAARLNAEPQRCVVVEDAESGVRAAQAAGMKVVGVGPPERVGHADRVVHALAELTADAVLSLLPR